ncbi:hypothetical protein [uncultured Draconibacterium sp.]|uniref:hypothetical protein n=1 Tax=uncultured Draconibacterium sp. TaxID=1573823 RepID=UPI0029C092EB|nr:hypothetical protein [uncultured Draconibacterium sp.]
MKKIFFLCLIPFLLSFTSDNDATKSFIKNYFDNSFQFICSDDNSGNVKIHFLYSKFDPETMTFNVVVPDSIPYSDFYKAYSGRIMDVYFKNRNTVGKAEINTILESTNCDIEAVKEKVIEYYSNDSVFNSVFKTALESYYSHSNKKDELNIASADKKIVSIDKLMKIALLQVDILNYDANKGFMYHFVCGVNPYSYAMKNNVNLLLAGFCQDAMKNKTMLDAHSRIMDELREQVKIDYPNEKDDVKGMCKKYQDKLRERLTEDGTLKQCLLEHYEKNKDVEPFILASDKE